MEEKTVQREDVLGEAIQILEIEGIANTTLEMVAERVAYPLNDLKRFWPDQEALLYDALRYLSPLRRADHLRKQPSLSRLPVYCRLYFLSGPSASDPSVGRAAKAGFAGLYP